MTTMTWTATAPAISSPNAARPALITLKAILHYTCIFFGASAANDSGFRGLDLNGNAMWAKN